MSTPQQHIDIAKEIAQKITEQTLEFGTDECIVDDWGRFSNFSLLCYLDLRNGYPTNKAKFSMRKIVNVIKKVIKEYENKGAEFREHECPKGTYYSAYGQSSFIGYDRRYISIDLDFHRYIPQENVFENNGTGEVMADGNQLEMFNNK